LFLITFNFLTPIDSILSASFFTVKQHIIFMGPSLSFFLLSSINFYIYFLTLTAVLYLLNLNYSFNYYYFRNSWYTLYLISIVFIILFFQF
jgi:uncharacterized metal-binding protein